MPHRLVNLLVVLCMMSECKVMITSIFLLCVAAGIIIGTLIVGFGSLGTILAAVAGLGIVTASVAVLLLSRAEES